MIAPMTCRNRKMAIQMVIDGPRALRGGGPRSIRRIAAPNRVMRPDSDGRGASAGPARAVCHKVDEDVLAEALRRRVEGAAAVHPGDERDELGERPRALEHERVDGDPVAGAALD